MEAMFTKMMAGCMKGMSEEDQKKMIACGEKMAAICPCIGTEDLSDEDRKAMREKIMAFCGRNMELMSACFKQTGSTPDQTCCSEKA